ncbi:hypothetical protein [Paenibacillus sp. FSL E2-0177]|uniref:hypothetical protein n=1 Tax=Paenibacillus sp. FSL E2-0177 TaxID=2921360 RepID=UPI0030EE9661
MSLALNVIFSLENVLISAEVAHYWAAFLYSDERVIRVETAAELKDVEMIVAEIAGPYRLNKKEQRLLAYLLDESKSKNIGDICKALKTTPITLCTKTKPQLERKIDAVGSEAWKRDLEAALKNSSVSKCEFSQWIPLFSRKEDDHGEKEE